MFRGGYVRRSSGGAAGCCGDRWRQARYCLYPDLFANVYMTETDADVTGGANFTLRPPNRGWVYFFNLSDPVLSTLPDDAAILRSGQTSKILTLRIAQRRTPIAPMIRHAR
jgi:hypothetical protein